MSFLVDTNVISEVRHPNGSARVKDRFRALPPNLVFTSAIVFGELSRGIDMLPDSKKKHQLESWCQQLEDQFGNRILPLDRQVARVWGALHAKCQQQGHSLNVLDAQIAATANRHELILITRSEKNFTATGVRIWNI